MASWQCMFDGERAECTVVGGETHINRKLAGWLAGWLAGCWEYVEARQSGSLLFWQTRADASTCNLKAARQERQGKARR